MQRHVCRAGDAPFPVLADQRDPGSGARASSATASAAGPLRRTRSCVLGLCPLLAIDALRERADDLPACTAGGEAAAEDRVEGLDARPAVARARGRPQRKEPLAFYIVQSIVWLSLSVITRVAVVVCARRCLLELGARVPSGRAGFEG